MHPAKPFAASKNAALASVISTPRRSKLVRHSPSARGRVALVEQRHGAPRPDRPVAQEAADDPALDGAPFRRRTGTASRGRDDGVVVPRVERDVVAPGIDDGPDDVERLVAVERSDLDGDHRGNFGEASPEGIRERPAADRRLQVEADERDAGGDGLAVRDERGIVRVLAAPPG